MRMYFSNADRPKAAAKILVRESGTLKLSAAQEAIARATGYRDWHDLLQAATPVSTNCADPAPWKQVILSITDALGVGYGDVQYALMRSRLLPDMTLEETLAIRASIWRERLFGVPRRDKPGTVVRIKESGSQNEPAYLLATGRPTHVLYDTGFGICADFEVVTPRMPIADFVPSRLWLPYGFWTLLDGSIVTFSRDYKPMWCSANGVSYRLHPWLWIDHICETTHFSTLAGNLNWAGGPARALALEHLRSHRIIGLPRLVDAMHFAFDPTVQSVGRAVARMQEGSDTLAA
jgi:hypothetical protein